MRNTYKFTKMYSGAEPQFVEGDVFRITIPLTEVATATVRLNTIDPKSGVRSGVINGAIKLTENEQAVLNAISNNPNKAGFPLKCYNNNCDSGNRAKGSARCDGLG